ncbi:MAG TPA: HAD family phosphatase [Candidatus Didemnitutus sp.]|nr:HAD family phosphatase [Candidatus Didemnitutus sp.]
MPPVAAPSVIFDWDGVIVDSSRAHEIAWEQLGVETGRPMPEGHFKAGFGRKNEQIIPQILKWQLPEAEIVRLGRRKEELYREALKDTGIAPLPGVIEFLNRLRGAGIACAVGSSTERKNIETIMGIIGLADTFRAIVSAEDVTRGKPDPQVFLTAARRIGADPRNCVVFEDAFAGLEAARAGGMKAIGVATTHPADALVDRADRVVHRLDEVSVADLQTLVTG